MIKVEYCRQIGPTDEPNIIVKVFDEDTFNWYPVWVRSDDVLLLKFWNSLEYA